MTVPSELASRIAELVDAAVSAAANSTPAPAVDDDSTYLLRAEQAAERLGVSRSQVYAMVKSGELEGVRVGRWINVPLSSVKRYIAANRISAA
ncbi:helix-turn-helix domain-containing protein [Mycolicibacterium brumae]|uniref:helix-turn-helix domain-containing protein n=1 Tax=Mycolicibacterium brumae TaxID=85968 RepID=UPI000ACA9442|nr:helix-turn-helix domain-containing protein [Mycolicibacterium brumae]MCV7194135.1 helix-turn-helix domain-containing protein [Mycolicibacterium brumae]RWA22692.1 hypothetical protein MBRU_12140 [Mycolicibacterium brumae DSM 44177]UWW07502.1 helix-turn-helix domain-containing protein [Mycolicibacterium brumae]